MSETVEITCRCDRDGMLFVNFGHARLCPAYRALPSAPCPSWDDGVHCFESTGAGTLERVDEASFRRIKVCACGASVGLRALAPDRTQL